MPYPLNKNHDEILYKIIPGVIHDIRNPLAVLKLNNYYLKILEDLPENIKSTVQDSSKAILKIQNSLENLSGLFSKKTKILCSLNDLTESAVQLTSGLSKKHKINIEFKADKSIPPIYIDKASILYVIICLLITAMEGGKTSIKISNKLIDKKIKIKIEGPEKNMETAALYEQKKEAIHICEQILPGENCKAELKNSKKNGSIYILTIDLNMQEK
jgi:K+-sensing histidine kinase KdpD